ncbi:MAG TPA: alpha/beta hydrolase [Burkholderiales bacterium]|nr:alpha/beta hydrolase [Burkholderiales bacterium]
MRESRSVFLDVRGLRYHVRAWGSPHDPQLWLLHGWMDMSASFQFVVDALQRNWYVLAPDWRGCGLSQWSPGSYWFPDYLADLDEMLRQLAPQGAIDLAGHSMGGNVANLYAGVRPGRVRRLALLEGFGLPRTAPAAAPDRYAKWLEELTEQPSFRSYATLAEVEDRLMQNNPRLSRNQAAFLAPHWAQQTESGKFVLRGDPAHKRVNPVLYRLDEAIACWRRIEAPVLWVWGDGAWMQKWFKTGEEDLAERRAAFRHLQEVRLSDCGHMMHHDQPDQLARRLEDFFQ